MTPIFEGGAMGQEIPVTVEIRSDFLLNQDPPLAVWQKTHLPEKVKER